MFLRFLYISVPVSHDDVIKWEHFPRYWPFVWGIDRSPVNSLHKGQWREALMFSLICALNKRLSKHAWGWWLGTPSGPLWRHCNVVVSLPLSIIIMVELALFVWNVCSLSIWYYYLRLYPGGLVLDTTWIIHEYHSKHPLLSLWQGELIHRSREKMDVIWQNEFSNTYSCIKNGVLLNYINICFRGLQLTISHHWFGTGDKSLSELMFVKFTDASMPHRP